MINIYVVLICMISAPTISFDQNWFLACLRKILYEMVDQSECRNFTERKGWTSAQTSLRNILTVFWTLKLCPFQTLCSNPVLCLFAAWTICLQYTRRTHNKLKTFAYVSCPSFELVIKRNVILASAFFFLETFEVYTDILQWGGGNVNGN